MEGIIKNWDASKRELKNGLQRVIYQLNFQGILGVLEDLPRRAFQLLSLEFEFRCTVSESSLVELRKTDYRNAQISHGIGIVGGVDIAFAAVERSDSEEGTVAFVFGDLNSVDPNSFHDSGRLPLYSVLTPMSDKGRKAVLTFFP